MSHAIARELDDAKGCQEVMMLIATATDGGRLGQRAVRSAQNVLDAIDEVCDLSRGKTRAA